MVKGSFTLPSMAPTGQLLAHLLQPLHFSGTMEMVFSFWHWPAGQRFSRMWASYSLRKLWMVLTTGKAALLPRPHRAVAEMVSASSKSSSMSPSWPSPPTMRSRISSIRRVPSRQGTHLPQLSFWVKFMKKRATSTMQVWSSITTSPPLPIIAPTFFRLSKSSGRSRCSAVRQAPEGPPICTALKLAPPRIPPPTSKIISRRVVPMGTSMRPVFSMFPVRAKALVPGLFSGPIPLYQAAPFCSISGTLAKVSTLFKTVGFSNRPCSTVRGGFTRGMPRLPSIEAVRALPSPHTKAPAPRLICSRKEKPLPRMFSPSRPCSSAWAMAMRSRSTAMGYSART